MKSMLQKDGCNVIADILTGSDDKLNGIYVTYAGTPVESVQEVDYKTFTDMAKMAGRGYARIPVRSCKRLDDGRLLFTALLSASDLIGAAPNRRTKLTTATLVSMKDDPSKDRFVYSAVLTSQCPMVAGTHIVIDLTMKIGG